jgi:hypothetical protein
MGIQYENKAILPKHQQMAWLSVWLPACMVRQFPIAMSIAFPKKPHHFDHFTAVSHAP